MILPKALPKGRSAAIPRGALDLKTVQPQKISLVTEISQHTSAAMKYITLVSALFPVSITCWVIGNHAISLTSPDVGDVSIVYFPWSDIAKETGIDPKDVISNPDPDQSQTFKCPAVGLFSRFAIVENADKGTGRRAGSTRLSEND